MAISRKTINTELARLGYQARLARGDGYFYFQFGEVAYWFDRTVRVPTLSSLSVEQWIEEFHKLREKNQAMAHSVKGPMNERDFKKHLEEFTEGKPEAEHTHRRDPEPSAVAPRKTPKPVAKKR